MRYFTYKLMQELAVRGVIEVQLLVLLRGLDRPLILQCPGFATPVQQVLVSGGGGLDLIVPGGHNLIRSNFYQIIR
jgi:hypothetical protein